MNENRICVFYTTFSSEEEASQLSEKMVKGGFAACSNIQPIKSCYFWEGQFNKDDEVSCILKTTAELAASLMEQIERQHPYDLPCVLHWEVNVNQAYKEWVESNTKS